MLKLSGAGRCGGEFGGAWSTAGSGSVVVRVLLVVALAASVLQFAHGPAAAQADTEAPTLVSATIAHGRLVLTYNEALHTGQTPHWRWFTARVTAPAARARTLEFNAVVVSGKTLTATMPLTKSEGVDSAAVVAGETVVVSYDHSEPQGSAQPIRDAAGNRAAALTDRAVENLTDPSPVVVSARVLRDSLSITFDRPLSTADDAVPDGGQFTVGLLRDGAMRQIRAPQGEGWVSVDGSAVSVRLSDGVRPGDTGVTVSYSHSSGSTTLTEHLRGAGDAGGLVAPFSDRAVVNAATAAPAPTGAVFVDDSLLLTFDAPLDPGAVPDPSQFVVTYDEFGATRSYDVAEGGVAVSGPTVTLTLTSNTSDRFPLLELDYMRTTPDDAEVFTALRGVGDGGEVLPFTDLAVTLSRPRLAATGGAVVEGSTLTLTFDTALDDGADHVPDKSQFTVTVTPAGGTAQVNTVTAVAVSGQTVTLTLTNSVAAGSSVLVSYAQDSPSADLTKKLRGATAPYPLVAAFTELDLAKPGLSATGGAVVDGSTLTLTFDKALDDGAAHVPDKSQFTVAVTPAGATPQVNAVTAVAVSGQTVTLTLTAPVAADSSVRVSYAQDSPSSDLTKKLRGATAPNPLVTAFSGFAIEVADTTAPTLAATGGAVVDGSTLTLTFDTALDDGADHVPDKSQFTVAVTPAGGTAQTNAVTAVAVSGQTVTLTLTTPVAADSTATVSYTQDSPSADLTKKLRGATAPNPLAAAFADQAVTNVTPPALVSASVNGDTLELVFDVELDASAANRPTWPQFLVTVTTPDSIARTMNPVTAADGVAVAGKTLTLRLPSPVRHGDTLAVDYSQTRTSSGSTAALLRGANGAAVAAFENVAVTNDTPPAPPALVSARISASVLVLGFDRTLDHASVPGWGQFEASITTSDGIESKVYPNATSGVLVIGDSVTLILTSGAAAHDTVTVAYSRNNISPTATDDPVPLRGANESEVAAFSGEPVDKVPDVASASVDATTLTLMFDAALDAAAVPHHSQFTVTVTPAGGTAAPVAVAPDGVAIEGAEVALTLASAVATGDTVTVSYSRTAEAGATKVLLLAAGGAPTVNTFTGVAVTNNTPVPAPPAPVSASVDATVLTLVFDAALDETRVPHLSQFSVMRTPSGGSAADVAVASGGVLVSGAEVALTLASAVAAGDTVTVGYSQAADASATAVLLRAAAAPNAEADAFTGQAVTNDTPEPPAPVSGSVNGDTLMLVFDAELDVSATLLPTWPQFTVAATGPGADPLTTVVYPVAAAGGIAVAGTTVTLKLRSPVGHGDTVTVAYSQTDTSLSSTARLLTGADGLAVADFSGRAVTNVTALEPLSASAAADTLTMVFNAALDATRVPHGSQFEVMVAPESGGSAAGVDVAPDGVAVEGAEVALTLASPVARGDTVTVGYSKTADSGATAVLLRAEAAPNLEADAFAGQSVTNVTAVTVPADWTLKPSGLGAGDQFRLLIVTATTRDASSIDISDYDSHVQTAVAAGHAGIQSHSSQFKVLASTASVAARDHTETTYTSADKGVPIYWLGGAKAADEYEDFYDGSWDSYVFRDQTGNEASLLRVWTGTNNDGTAASNFLGSTDGVGAGTKTSGKHFVNSVLFPGITHPFYGLSAVFQVAAAVTPPSLSALTVSAGTLMPGFAGGTLDYAVPGLAYGHNRITVTATADADATVAYEDGAGNALSDVDAVTAGDQFDLAVGENTIKVKVARGDASRTYTLTLTRAAPAVSVSAAATAGEGDLLMFTVTRTPAAGDALTVTVNVAESGDLVPAASEGDRTVTIAADATAATLTVATGADDSDWEEHSTVTVTAPPGAGYTLGVASASTLVQDDDFPAAEAALVVSPTTVDESGTATVTVTVTTDADQQPHGRGGTLTVAAGGGTAVSGSDYDTFNQTYALDAAGFSAATVGGSPRWQAAYSGTVTVSDDTTQESAETFNITLTKANAPTVTLASPFAFVVTIPANDAPAASSDAGLSALSLSGVTLSPDFAATTYDYTASVANSVSSTTVAAAQNHAGAEVVITPTTDADAGAAGHQVNLDAGSNTITVKVTAEDDTTTRTYTVTVTRAAPAPPAPVSASVDATVLTLVFDAALDEARVPHLSQFTVTRTPSGGSAADVAVASGGVLVSGAEVALTLASAVAAGDTVTVGYSKAADASATAVLLRAAAAPNLEAAAFTGRAVTNDTPEPPAPVSGSVNGDTLMLVFDAELDASATLLPTWPQFTVAVTKPDNTARTVYPVTAAGGIVVAGTTVTLKLRSPVGHGDTVTVAYSQTDTSLSSTARLLTGADGLAVAGFSGRAVANVTALEPLSASAAADTLTMVFNAALDAARVPHGSQFEVMVAPAGGGSAAGVDVVSGGVAVEGAAVALTLASPVARGDTVTVGYSKTADSGATAVLLRAEAAPNAEADAFAGREVTNDTPPAPVSASVNGVTLVLVFDAELDASAESLPTWPQFTVAATRPDNTATTVSPVTGAGGVAVEGMTVTLTLGSPVAHDDHEVKVAYSQSTTFTSGDVTTTARLLAGADGLAVAEFSAQDVDNVTPAPPMLESAKVDGVTLTMVFDTALDAARVPHHSQFTVTKTPAGGTAADVAVASGGVAVTDTTVTLTLASAVAAGDAVTVGYSKTADAGATAMLLRAEAAPNLEADAFTGQDVTNVTAAPSLSALTVSAGTLTPGFAGGTLDYAVPGLAYGHNRITVTATADADATVSYEDGSGNTLSDADANTAGDQFDLAVGENTIKVKVARGDASQTYTLTLTRAKPVVSVGAAAATAGEGDLLMFTVTRTPAAGDALTVTVNVAESGDLVPAASEGDRTVTIAADAAAATLTVATGADDSDWEEHSTVTVTAPPGAGYTLGVASASTLVQDDDFPAAEAALVVSPTTVDESGTATVTVTVTTDADQQPHGRGGTLTVAAGGGTAVSGSDYDTFNQTYALDAAGFSAATVGGSPRWQAAYSGTVTVSDDTTQESAETFNITLTKANAPKVTLASPFAFVVTIPANDAPAASSDAGLSALSLSGVTLSPDFAATTYDYTASVANSVSSTTVAAAQNHAGAEVVITPTTDADADAAGHQVNLDAGSNTITVKVTAEDDTTTRTYTVTVTRAAPAPPAPVSASVDATVLTLVFDAALDEARVPHLSQFTVTRTPSGGSAADVAVASGGVLVSGAEVALTLASAVAAGDTVTVGYSKAADASATAVLLRAAAAPNLEAAAFTGRAVTNDTPEPPAPVSGSVNGDTLMLVFDAELDASATLLPTWPQFTVAVTKPDNTARTVYPVTAAGGIVVAGTTVTLKLRSPVGHGDTVTVAYSQTDTSLSSTARLLTGADGLAVAGFSGRAVANVTALEPLSASAAADTLTMVFNAALDAARVPHGSQFEVMVAPAGGGSAAGVDVVSGGVAVEGAAVALTLASPVARGDTVTVGYSKTADSGATAVLLRAEAAPNAEADAFAGREVTNDTPPAPVSASVNGVTLVLVFDAELDASAESLPTWPQFTVAATRPDNTATTVSPVTGAGGVAVEGMTVTLTLGSPVAHDDHEVKVAYSQSTTSTSGDVTTIARLLAGADGLAVAEFSAQDVDNVTPAPPMPVSAKVDGVTLTMVFDTALDAARVPHHSQFTVTKAPAGGTAADVAVASGGVAVTDTTVALTLASPVVMGDAVTVGYSKTAGAGATAVLLRAEAAPNLEADAFTGQSVTNVTAAPSLSALTVSAGTLTPGFAGGTLDYAVPGLAYGHNRITVTATADADATVSYEDGSGNTLSDADANTAGDQFDLAVGENTIKVKVARGDASQTYTLTLTRAKPVVSVGAAAAAAGEGDLLMFTVTRTPAAGDALTVTVNVAESGDLVPAASEGDRTVTIAADAAAETLTVNTGADDSDWEEHSTVTVTAPPNTSYTLGVASASTLVQDDDFPAATAALAVSPTTVDESGTATVTVTVTTDADQQPHGPGGTLTVAAGGGTAVSGSDYDAFNQTYALDAAGFSAATVGGSPRWQAAYTGTVTVSDDTTQESAETFNITLTKANAPKVTLASPFAFVVTIPANDAPAASSDAGLSALSLSGVTLSPDFAATTYDYTASVANSVSSTTVAAAQNHAGAEVVITPTTDADAGAAGHQVNLDAGSNTITVKVTAEDDTTTRTYTVMVTRAAPAPPAPVSASVDATVLTLVFDAALDEARVPHLSQFTVTRTPSGGSAADVAVASGGVLVSGAEVALTLASAVAAGDTVTVGYSKAADASATAVLLRAAAAPNLEAAAFTGRAVTNDTPEPPAPVSGSVNGDTLMLVFDAELDASATLLPTWPQFTVAVTKPDNTARTVYPVTAAGGIAVAGTTVTLKLRSPVGHGDTVTVAYSQTDTSLSSTARLLTGADGLAVAGFSGRAVANVTALEPLSASAAADTLTMVFNAALDAARVPHGSQFEVMVAPAGGGSAAGVDVVSGGVAVEGAAVALTLASPVARGDTVTVGYSKTADSGATAVLLRAEAAPNAEADAFAGREVTNDTPPAPVSASVNGVTLVLVFDAELDASAESLPTWPQFTVAATRPDNTATTVSPVTGAGGVAVEGMTVTLTLGSPVAHDDHEVKVAYSQSTTFTSGDVTTTARLLAGADGLAVAEFSAQDVDNVTPAPPMPESAKVDGVTLTMVFDTALDAARVPHHSQFTVTKTPAGGTAADVAVASGGVAVTDTTVPL